MKTVKFSRNGFAIALMVVFALTSCVKNEEAEGVKAIREAQAALIQARASAEALMAQASANYTNAQAAYMNAQAEHELAITEYQNLQNQLKELEIAMQIEEDALELERMKLQYELWMAELELQQARMANDLAIAALEAEQELMDAQLALEDAKAYYEMMMARYATDNPALDEYWGDYEDVLDDILSLNRNIASAQIELSWMQLYDGDYGESLAEKALRKGRKEAELTYANDALTLLQSATGDVEAKAAALLEAENNYEVLRVAYTDKYAESEEKWYEYGMADQARDEAYDAMEDAYDAYDDGLMYQGYIEFFESDDVVGSEYIDSDAINAVDRELVSSSDYYYSIAYYDAIIADAGSTDEQKEEATIAKGTVEAVVAYYKTMIGGDNVSAGIAALQAAYFTAKATYEEADELANTLYDEYVALWDEYNMLSNELSYVSWVVSALESSLENLQNKIEDLENNIADLEYQIAQIDMESTSWENEIAYQEEYIANLQAELQILEAMAAELKALIDAELGE
nr:hypothetical protein [uncultured Carboxylicivirga sp.]